MKIVIIISYYHFYSLYSSNDNHYFLSYKKQIEDAEEIAALNLAKYRKAQQQLEEADERSQAAESNMVRMRAGTPSTDRIAEIRNEHGRFMSPFFVSNIKNLTY